MTCLLGLGLAEAGERVMPEPDSAVDVVVGEQHAHHDSSLEHDSDDADAEHCPDCCHAPCFWVASGDYRLPFNTEALLIRTSSARRFTSERPPSLFRPPIA